MNDAERDGDLLVYIRETITRIEQYCAGGKDVFLRDSMVQDAALRRLETLADAANRLSDEVKLHHAEIPWREIYGFRNVAAHGYLQLDVSRVWMTIEAYLPALKKAVDAELSHLDLP